MESTLLAGVNMWWRVSSQSSITNPGPQHCGNVSLMCRKVLQSLCNGKGSVGRANAMPKMASRVRICLATPSRQSNLMENSEPARTDTCAALVMKKPWHRPVGDGLADEHQSQRHLAFSEQSFCCSNHSDGQCHFWQSLLSVGASQRRACGSAVFRCHCSKQFRFDLCRFLCYGPGRM